MKYEVMFASPIESFLIGVFDSQKQAEKALESAFRERYELAPGESMRPILEAKACKNSLI